MARHPDIDFVPIIGMTADEVSSLLSSVKCYIDFGNHPGKDRLPREACIMGCCVITSLRGSAGNEVDVPIPRSFKFRDKFAVENLDKIGAKIKEVFTDFKHLAEMFQEYAEFITNEQAHFEHDARQIFMANQ